MMNTVAEQGPVRTAVVPGYSVAGKSGTASIPGPTGYIPSENIASYAGFMPLEKPKNSILVKIDRPQGVQWGSQVAAPFFSSIAQEALLYLRLPPTKAKDTAKKN